MNENIPEVAGLEDPTPGDLNARAHIDDGLSDLEELSNDDEVVETSDLVQFASALQEAQRHAICLEIENAKTKRKTLKTYLGHSKATIACSEKAHQSLAVQGFHDIFSFIALKEREQMAGKRSLGGGKAVDRPLAGIVTTGVPGRGRYGDLSSNVSASGAIDVSRYSSPGGKNDSVNKRGGRCSSTNRGC